MRSWVYKILTDNLGIDCPGLAAVVTTGKWTATMKRGDLPSSSTNVHERIFCLVRARPYLIRPSRLKSFTLSIYPLESSSNARSNK